MLEYFLACIPLGILFLIFWGAVAVNDWLQKEDKDKWDL